MIFEVRNRFLGRLAGLGIDPVGDADFALGLRQEFPNLGIGAAVFHVGDGFDQRRQGAGCFAA